MEWENKLFLMNVLYMDIYKISKYSICTYINIHTHTQVHNMLYTWLDFKDIFQESVWQLFK